MKTIAATRTEPAPRYFPENARVVLVNTPYSFVDRYICPNQVSIGELQLVAFLKRRNNEVTFINMRSSEAHPWRRQPAGREGTHFVPMGLLGQTPWYLAHRLAQLNGPPDEIWVTSSFTCDADVVAALVDVCRQVYPRVRIVVGGKTVRVAPAVAEQLGVEAFGARIPAADLTPPDFSAVESWDYGLFKLEIGCPNTCSFCVASLDEPVSVPAELVIDYMREFYDRYKPKAFWNWDDNILHFPDHLERFLDLYRQSGMRAELKLEMGLEPDLVTPQLMRRIVAAGVRTGSLPMETASAMTAKKYHKPYTIISSIKMLRAARAAGIRMNASNCTFIIGHPDDDLSAIFRTFLAVLRHGGRPCPFPVFLFPGTIDFQRYREVTEHKSLAELHGQLWPLIPSVEVPTYQRLFEFLSQPDWNAAMGRLDLLTPEARALFHEEVAMSEEFDKRCHDSDGDSLENLVSIESRLKLKRSSLPAGRPEKLLYISASPRSDSVSKQLGEYLIEGYRKRCPTLVVDRLDLATLDLPFIDERFIQFLDGADLPADGPAIRLAALSEEFVGRLRGADRIVLATPMWVFSIPARLKAFFELVVLEGKTFELRGGARGLLPAKPTVCILSRKGVYDRSPFNRFNIQDRFLRDVFELMGIGTPTFVVAEGLGRQTAIETAMTAAKQSIDQVLATF